MTRVAHFVSFDIGGAGRTSLELVRLLVKKYPDLLVVYNEKSFPKYSSDTDHNEPVPDTYKEFKDLANMRLIKNTIELNDLGIDILHTHRSGDDMWFIPGLESMQRNFKIVETNFHGMQKTAADFRIFPSTSLMNFYGIKKNNSNAVVPNAVNTLYGDSFRSKFNLQKETIIFGRVGRSDKSIYTPKLLKQYSKIETSNTVLIWVGRSNLAESDAKKYKVSNIIWIDPVSNPVEMARFYATFDVYCHANFLGETFGNTVAEAVIRGLPVASLRGIRNWPQAQSELISSDQYCFSQRAYRNLLKKYRDDDTYRKSIGDINKEFGKIHLSSQEILERVSEIYKNLIDSVSA